MKLNGTRIGMMAIVAIGGAAAALPCVAAPLQPKVVSAKALWVLHLDVDALTATPLWHDLQSPLMHDRRLQAGIHELKTVSGLSFPQDMHDITVYSTAFNPRAGVVVVSAATNQNRVVNALKMNSQYLTAHYGHYTLRHWSDHGHSRWGSYFNKNTIVIGESKKPVEAALDVLAGKQPSLRAGAPLLNGMQGAAVLYVSGRTLNKIKAAGPKSPVVRQLRHAWMRLTQRGKTINIQAAIAAASPAAAAEIRKTIAGFQSMLELAGGPNAPRQAVLRAAAVKQLTVKVSGRVVHVQWSVSVKLAERAIEKRLAAHHGR